MRPVPFAALLALLLTAGTAHAQACSGCGCRGGPGYRGPDGRCVGWDALARTCGTPVTTRCTAEGVNARPGEAERPRERAAPPKRPAPTIETRPNPF